MKKKAVLGYSGGLDTSVLIRLIQEKYGIDVVAVTIDVGQEEDLAAIKEKALKVGACEARLIDVREEFVNEYVLPALKANALYENAYPLATALARPLIVKYLVAAAKDVNADYIAHGCTGKGNDQVRFESAIACLAPALTVLAPVREYSLSRDYEINYAQEQGIPIEEKLNVFSIDENLWGRSIECGPIENEDKEPPEDAFLWTTAPSQAPDYAAYFEITFDKGIPVALNGKRKSPLDIIMGLNKAGGKNGIGRIDHMESRLVGIKSREVYEAPAATILIRAHQDLEKLVLTKDVLHFKPMIETAYSELVYNGLWYSPLRCALTEFIESVQQNVSGIVKVKLYKGSVQVAGRSSVNSLYVKNLATYEGADEFDSPAAKGFIDIWSLPYKVYSMIHDHNSNAKCQIKKKSGVMVGAVK